MRSMDLALVFLIFLLQGLRETEALRFTGEEGQDIRIKCVHSNAYGNIKYFCNRRCADQDVLVTSKSTFEKHDEKYKIEDKGNTFIVTISQLSPEDSGTYWCGIDRVGIDTYNEVSIVVLEKQDNNDGNSAQISVSSLSSNTLVYIGASLGVAVLALAVVLLVFFRYRKRRISSSSGKNHDNTVYATPSTRKHDGRSDATTPCEEPEPDGGPPSRADGLLYSTVSFSRHTDSSASPPLPETVTYLSVKPHVSQDESTVYSNV